MVTVCQPAAYGYGHGYGHNYCKEVAQETCYNVPVLTVVEPEVEVIFALNYIIMAPTYFFFSVVWINYENTIFCSFIFFTKYSLVSISLFIFELLVW